MTSLKQVPSSAPFLGSNGVQIRQSAHQGPCRIGGKAVFHVHKPALRPPGSGNAMRDRRNHSEPGVACATAGRFARGDHVWRAHLLEQARERMVTFMVAAPGNLIQRYDGLASRYERMHQRWLRHAGGEGQAAHEACVRAFAEADSRILDAGAGTGTFARRLLDEGFYPAHITLLDSSSEMLRYCADLPCETVLGRLESTPFETARFDIIACAWVLETLPHPELAIAEMWRILRPGGRLCLTFCATRPTKGLADKILCQTLRLRGTGRFLNTDRIADCLLSQSGAQVAVMPVNGPVATLVARRVPEP